MTKFYSTAIVLLLACAMVVLFQNCSMVTTSNVPVAGVMGNEPYTGMSKLYLHYDLSQPCTTLEVNGQPLANDGIVFRPDVNGNIQPYLARQSCQDIVPVLLPANTVQIPAGSTASLTYNSQVFSSNNTPTAFEVVTASCPTGMTAIPGAVPTNLISHPLDWTVMQAVGQPGWYDDPGVNNSLYGTMQSLPAYAVQRNNASLLDGWRKTQQIYPTLAATTAYAYTVLVQAGSKSAFDFYFERSTASGTATEEVAITFDLQVYTATTQWVIGNITNISAVISPLGNGAVATVYFTTSSIDSQSLDGINIGITPSALPQGVGNLGDSIIATAAELVQVNQFCQ